MGSTQIEIPVKNTSQNVILDLDWLIVSQTNMVGARHLTAHSFLLNLWLKHHDFHFMQFDI